MPLQFDKEAAVEEEEESDIGIDSPTSDEVSEVCEDELNRMVKVSILLLLLLVYYCVVKVLISKRSSAKQ